MRLGVVTGLADEARCLRVFPAAVRPVVRCLGPGPGAAAAAARDLLDRGCDALVSFGVAGGLDPAMQPGRVIVADAVVTEQGELLETDCAWRERLLECLGPAALVLVGRIGGSDRPLTTPDQKRAWGARYGARAVDMESHAVAREARKTGAVVLVLRAIVDPVDRAIPPWLATAVDAVGRPKPLRIARGILRHPRDIGSLLQLGRGQAAALAALRHVALDAGPLFAFA